MSAGPSHAGALVVLAKAPVAGRSKTRCCPPCTPEQAAELAEAALVDTLAAVVATPADRRILVLDGTPGPWLPAGIDVIGQRGDGLDLRLASAFDDVGGPTLLIGMDTPQVTPGLLGDALAVLAQEDVDAVLGLADDGGFWAVGLRGPDAGAFLGVPMSTDRTGALQLARLRRQGRRVAMLPRLTDVDTFDVAMDVAARAPHGRFAASVDQITRSLALDVAAAGVSSAGPRSTP